MTVTMTMTVFASAGTVIVTVTSHCSPSVSLICKLNYFAFIPKVNVLTLVAFE